MRKRLLMAGALVAGVAAAGTFGATQMGPTVAVSLKEFKVIAPRSAKAGKITFVVRNKGTIKHEFFVVRTNRAPGKLPLKGSVAKLKGVKGMLKPFKPGKTRKLTLTLKRGKYVLLCNLPGHYKAGQFKGFRVR
jgi:uncharacterized cupredoxin-like copper-binding protein